MDDIIMLRRCTICGDPTLYHGPAMLHEGDIWCGQACAAFWDAMTPGQWIDAAELMPGRSLHNDPDLWLD